MSDPDQSTATPPADAPSRRVMLTLAATGTVAVGYGIFFAKAASFVYPARPQEKRWLFVTDVASMKPGDAQTYTSPTGAKVAIAMREVQRCTKCKHVVEDLAAVACTACGEKSLVKEADFLALSSTCPHLGCQVHWEPHNDRFFCPCHNGVFDPTGGPVSGPPKDANMALSQYPLRVENGLLFINVTVESLEGGTRTA